MNERRDQSLDWIKGLAIILVVMGHACTPALCEKSVVANVLYFLINSINMPIFFYISGLIYGKKKTNSTVSNVLYRKFKSLIVPYWAYTIFVWLSIFVGAKLPVLGSLLSKAGYSVNLADLFRGLVFPEWNVDKHLWFIYQLFWIFVIRAFVNHYLRDENIRKLVDCCTVLIALIIYVLQIRPIYTISSVLRYLVFFMMGEYSICKKAKKSHLVLFVIFEIIYAVQYFNKCEILYLENFTRLCVGYTSIALFMLLRSCIYPAVKKKSKTIVYLGVNSFWIYLVHQPFAVSGAVFVLSKVLIKEGGSNSYQAIIIIVVATIIGVVTGCIAIKIKGYYKHMFGRRE